MKTIILFIALSFNIFAQSNLIILMSSDPTVAGIDTIPSQFTFTDVTDAAVSSYNQAYIVVAGCDSARFYPASGDTIRVGALGTKTVSPIWLDAGDTLFTFNVASASNSTATHSIIYSSDGTPLDTFSVTTVAASGGGLPTPVLNLVYNTGVTSDANGKVTAWTDGTYTFIMADTSLSPSETDSSIYFPAWGTNRRLDLADAEGNPFDIGTGDMSVEVWMYANGGTCNIIQKDEVWSLAIVDADGNKAQFYAHDASYTDEAIVRSPSNPTGGAHQIIMSWDRDGYAIIAFDSVSTYATDVDFADLLSTNLNSTDPARIGGAVSGSLGHIFAIRFYDEALTPTQIKAKYEDGRP